MKKRYYNFKIKEDSRYKFIAIIAYDYKTALLSLYRFVMNSPKARYVPDSWAYRHLQLCFVSDINKNLTDQMLLINSRYFIVPLNDCVKVLYPHKPITYTGRALQGLTTSYK